MSIDTAILERIAAETDTDPLDLPPLYEAIDPDGLERCLESVDPSAGFEFDYSGYRVTIDGTGEIGVEAIERRDSVPTDSPAT